MTNKDDKHGHRIWGNVRNEGTWADFNHRRCFGWDIALQGKKILVTGLGVETARSLAAHGAQVVGAARDLKKAEAATALVRKKSAAKGDSFEIVELDLANLRSVRACADHLLERGERSTLLSPTRV
jgi:uncharacterized Ntn-hydrolase superfamily protein